MDRNMHSNNSSNTLMFIRMGKFTGIITPNIVNIHTVLGRETAGMVMVPRALFAGESAELVISATSSEQNVTVKALALIASVGVRLKICLEYADNMQSLVWAANTFGSGRSEARLPAKIWPNKPRLLQPMDKNHQLVNLQMRELHLPSREMRICRPTTHSQMNLVNFAAHKHRGLSV
jgi:hypothetical protein